MENNSGLRPVGRAVLVMPYEPNVSSSSIVIPDTIKTNHMALEQRAIVIEVGPECWKEERWQRAVPGDRVLISAFCGHMAKGIKDSQQYKFVNDRDIFAKIEDQEND